MTQQAEPAAGALIRVTVASGSRRVDLVLPSVVPVAELVPELARSVGLLDPSTVYGGYRLVTTEGRVLRPDTGLLVQGVPDGSLLTVAAGVDDEPARVYDDVVEAMADAVEEELPPWRQESGRRTALGASALLLSLGAVAMLFWDDARPAGLVAACVALLLDVGAIMLSRASRQSDAAVTAALTATGYAGVAGLLLVDRPDAIFPFGEGLFGTPLAALGAGVLISGVIALIGLADSRVLALPAVLVGALFAVAGLVIRETGADPAVLLTVVLLVAVLAGSVFPWLALGATGAASTSDEQGAVDVDAVRADALVAHEILIAVTVTVGVLVVLLTPMAVSLGVAGTLLAVLCCLVVMLRTRQHRSGSQVLVGLLSGVLGLAVTGVAVLAVHPDWRAAAAVLLAVGGLLMLLLALIAGSSSARRSRLADVVETVCLIALLPLAVVATGAFSALASLSGG